MAALREQTIQERLDVERVDFAVSVDVAGTRLARLAAEEQLEKRLDVKRVYITVAVHVAGIARAQSAEHVERPLIQPVERRGDHGLVAAHLECPAEIQPVPITRLYLRHVLPLAEPGAVKKALKALNRKGSPFYIKPRIDPRLWLWLWSFARRCNVRDRVSAGHARKPLLDSSMALYRELLEQESLDCEWEERGCLFVYHSAQGM